MNDLRSRVRVGVLVIGVFLPLGAALAWKAGAQPGTWLAMGAIGVCCLIGYFQGKGIGGALAAFGLAGLAGSFFNIWPDEYLMKGYTYGIGAIVAGWHLVMGRCRPLALLVRCMRPISRIPAAHLRAMWIERASNVLP